MFVFENKLASSLRECDKLIIQNIIKSLTRAFLQLSIEKYFVSTDSASFVNKNVVNSYMMSYLIGQKHT